MPTELEDNDQDLDLEQQDDSQQDPPAQADPAPAPSVKDDDGVKAALAELTQNVNRLATPQTPAAEPQMSPEERKKYWAIYDPEDSRKDFMRKFFRMNEDASPEEVAEAKALFAEMQEGLTRQAVVTARNLFQHELAKMREELQPTLEYVSKAQAEATKQRFYSKYDSLSDAKYAKIIAATAQALSSQTFDSEESYFKALAESAAETIKGVVPEFDLGSKPKTNKTAGTTPRLPRTSVGGTGGTGGGNRSSGPVDHADSVLD